MTVQSTKQPLFIDDNVVVSMSYRLENGDGEELDSSQGQLPLVYMHNTNSIMVSLEREITGKQKGDAFDVVIYPEDGYGYPKEELIQELPIERFEGIDVVPGLRVKASNKESNETEMMTVTEVREDSVVVDSNHPLAGQILLFKIVIVDVREPTEQELAQGYALSTNPQKSG